MPIFNSDGDPVRLTPEEEAMLDWKPGANDWFQNGQPNFNLVSNYSPAVLSHEGDINQRGSQWSPEEGFGPNWNSYNSPGGDLSWLSYAKRQGLNQDYRQASEAQKSAYNAWVEPIIRANNKDGNGFLGGLMDFIQNGVLATPLAIPVLGGLASAAGLLGSGASAAAPGWVSAEGGAGYLGGLAADASELAALGGAAGSLPNNYWNMTADAGGPITDAGSQFAGGDLVGSDWAIGQATGPAGGLLPTTAEGLTAANGAGLGLLQGLPQLPPTPPGGGGGGADAVGSDWATGQATGPAGGLLPQTTGGLTAANGAGALSTGGTALSRVLDSIKNGTTPNAADLLQLGGQALPGILGAISSSEQTGALQDIANQQAALRKPFYDKSVQYLNNPSSFYTSNEGGAASDAILRRLSIGGNPADNPTKLAAATNGLYSNYQGALTGLANLGLSGQDTVARTQTNAVNQSGNTWSDLGSAFNSVFNPQQSLTDLLKQYGGTNWNSSGNGVV